MDNYNYNFNLNKTGSYIQQGLTLPNPRDNCKDYTVSGCTANNCSTCGGFCSKGCEGYLNQQQTENDDLCCHFNTSQKGATCCATGCGQAENMAACGIVVEDQLSGAESKCSNGFTLACTRSCKSRCLDVPGLTTNYFPYMGIFQVNSKSDTSTSGCEIHHKNCSENDQCTQMINNNSYNPWQNCIYDANEFAAKATDDDMNAWEDKFVSSAGDRNFDELTIKWCSQSVDGHCFTDPLDPTNTPKSCSRYFQNSAEGRKCRDWVKSHKSANQKNNLINNYQDAIAYNYCSNYNTFECKCVNRGQDSTYRESKYSFPFNDGCWYNPCTPGYSQNYFQPSDVDIQLNEAQCPTDVCINVTYASDYQKTYIENNKVYIDC